MPRSRPSVPPHWPARLVLWLAAGLFVFQVALHASMPAGANMNMAEWLDQLVTGQPMTGQATTGQVGMAGMDTGPLEAGHPDSQAPHAPGHVHHAEGLCCMTPVALLPALWTPPPPPLGRRTLALPKAVHEALLILRATARGPPLAGPVRLLAV